MAREEHPRENLLLEATALIPRIEIRIEGMPAPVVVGFRASGGASFYFGDDPAYHFNSQGELRRAFVDGRLVKAENGSLVTLTRRRTPAEVLLVARELSAAEGLELLAAARTHLRQLESSLALNRYTVQGEAPANSNALPRVRRFLQELPAALAAASAPHCR